MPLVHLDEESEALLGEEGMHNRSNCQIINLVRQVRGCLSGDLEMDLQERDSAGYDLEWMFVCDDVLVQRSW